MDPVVGRCVTPLRFLFARRVLSSSYDVFTFCRALELLVCSPNDREGGARTLIRPADFHPEFAVPFSFRAPFLNSLDLLAGRTFFGSGHEMTSSRIYFGPPSMEVLGTNPRSPHLMMTFPLSKSMPATPYLTPLGWLRLAVACGIETFPVVVAMDHRCDHNSAFFPEGGLLPSTATSEFSPLLRMMRIGSEERNVPWWEAE